MKVTITRRVPGSPDGIAVFIYNPGEEHEVPSGTMSKDLAEVLVSLDAARYQTEDVRAPGPSEFKEALPETVEQPSASTEEAVLLEESVADAQPVEEAPVEETETSKDAQPAISEEAASLPLEGTALSEETTSDDAPVSGKGSRKKE